MKYNIKRGKINELKRAKAKMYVNLNEFYQIDDIFYYLPIFNGQKMASIYGLI